jgi:Zn-dependent protease
MLDTLIEYIYVAIAALIAIVLHELSHGLMSYALGDPTPKNSGRLTLNPAKHLDLVGTICLILFHVGWAKPVMIDSRYYKNQKLGTALVALAGPLANFIIAFLASLLMIVFYINLKLEYVGLFFQYLAIINIGLGVFNLIPLPPLDGSKIIASFLPNNVYMQFRKYERYGMVFIIVILMLLSLLSSLGYPSILEKCLEYIYNFFVNIWLKILY